MRSLARAAVTAMLVLLLGVAPAVSPAQVPAPAVAAPPATTPAPAPVPTAVAPLDPAQLEAFVDGVVRDAMAADHIPGVTVSVVQNGQVVLKKGYGFARLTPDKPVDPDRTLFRLASISKTFTWIAVMKEVEAGRIRLDAPVNLYLPEKVQVREKLHPFDREFDRPVRVIDLMSHTPGFEDRALGQLFERDAERVRPPLVYLRQERPRRVREPGTVPSYSNYGAALAGAAAAWVSGKPYERLVESEITGPLGMNRTTFRDPSPARGDLPGPMPKALAADVADGFLWTSDGWRRQPYEYTAHIAAAGGGSSTAGDMSRYMLMLLNGGSLDGVQIYNAGTAAGFIRAATRPHAGVPGMAHGFREIQLPGGRSGWGHDGALLSFRSQMTLVPTLNLGVFIAANSESGSRLTATITGRIIQRFYGPQPTLPDHGSAWLKQNARAFAGQYVNNRRAYGGLEKFIDLINLRAEISVTDQGYLKIADYERTTLWVPDGRDGRFREVGGWRRLVFAMNDGRATGYWASGGVTFSERVGFLGRLGWLVNFTILAVIAALATLAGVLMRNRKEHRETTTQVRASLLQTTQAVLWLLAVGAFATWAARASDITAIFFDWPGGLMLTASSCALVASLLSAVVLVLLPFVWRGGRRVDSWTLGRKLRFTATAMIYAVFSLMLFFWGALAPWLS